MVEWLLRNEGAWLPVMHRIATLNIRQGAGRRAQQILTAVAILAPDTIVLTEYRKGPAGEKIREGLAAEGLKWQLIPPSDAGENTVLVACREPLEVCDQSGNWQANRYLMARNAHFNVLAAYLPPNKSKRFCWERLVSQARHCADEPSILIGDFNTGKHFVDEAGATFLYPEYINELEAIGYVDAWRALNPDGREYTWYSPVKANGFRLDYAFLSAPLVSALQRAVHHHEPRLYKITDHSALAVDLDLMPAGGSSAGLSPSTAPSR